MVKRDISWDEALKPDFSLMIFCTFFRLEKVPFFFVKYLFCHCMVSKYFVCTKF